MPNHPFYRTTHWKRLRQAALERDAYTCTVIGCRARATHVDHIVSRRNGGSDTLTNLRSLCQHHDNMVKERPDGTRANNGKLKIKGSDHNGWPLDPNHHWNHKQ